MLSVLAARERVLRTVERSQRTWAAALADPASAQEDPELAAVEMPLHPPTEKAALADLAEAIAWTQSWRNAAAPERGAPIDVIWEERRWPSAGTQHVPVRLRIAGANALAAFSGKRREWERVARRARAIGAWASAPRGDLGAMVRRHALAFADLDDGEFGELLGAVDWLVAHPVSGKRVREIPIRGVDTKWLERRRTLVEALFQARTGDAGLGLAESTSLLRVRFLDPMLRPGGVTESAMPLSDLVALGIRPRVVYVFENLESVLAMPQTLGAVVVHGSGYAVSRLAQVPWIRDARVVYWGDLDSDGFQILNGLRVSGIDAESVLMDVAAVQRYADLAGTEPRRAPGDLSALTAQEQSAAALLQSMGGARIEQERIPWADALHALRLDAS